mmetsp:Transcript_28829/g.80611  ORF Transcript_28829/g.80611 Transcript_28829/m.80611 type:complete len:215 (-) Transcript_28829:193-837(-)
MICTPSWSPVYTTSGQAVSVKSPRGLSATQARDARSRSARAWGSRARARCRLPCRGLLPHTLSLPSQLPMRCWWMTCPAMRLHSSHVASWWNSSPAPSAPGAAASSSQRGPRQASASIRPRSSCPSCASRSATRACGSACGPRPAPVDATTWSSHCSCSGVGPSLAATARRPSISRVPRLCRYWYARSTVPSDTLSRGTSGSLGVATDAASSGT